MGSILPRKRKDGSTGYTVNIRIKQGGVIVHRESETFERESVAKAWMKKREGELAQPGALVKVEDPTLATVIVQYNKEKMKAHGKTKTQVLKAISDSSIGKLKCSAITSPVLVQWVQDMESQPQTRLNYVSHLASIFTVARPAWGYPLDEKAMEDARVVMQKLGLVSKSKKRQRRPTLKELDKLMTHFETIQKKRCDSSPMCLIVLFAIFSTRRQEEITRVTGKDLDREHLELIVRDMKNPGEKIGNDVRTKLTSEALKCIDTQPKTDGIIWPYNAESISTAFTRACKFLGIEDLHFHDLRHDGISRLFELGWTIPQVAEVSGHRSWESLKRYTHIRQSGDKYAGWHWLKLLD
jgi:integrase